MANLYKYHIIEISIMQINTWTMVHVKWGIMVQKKTKIENNLIGEELKDYRLGMGYTIKELIQIPIKEGRLDKNWISERSVSNFEQGHNIPSLPTLKKLAVAYQIELIDLIEDIEDYLWHSLIPSDWVGIFGK